MYIINNLLALPKMANKMSPINAPANEEIIHIPRTIVSFEL